MNQVASMPCDYLQSLSDAAPELQRALMSTAVYSRATWAADEVLRKTVSVPMRDGVGLKTDLLLPPRLPAPAVAMRTPYGRANTKMLGVLVAIAQRGYVVISQDCRGTGDSEPDHWDYYVYEPEDSFDFVEWVIRQKWFGGFLGALGSSYVAQTQWCMAVHPRMSAIVPEVSGLGFAPRTARKHMFYDAYARSVGKGTNKVSMSYEELEHRLLQETLAGGYFNEPLHRPMPEALLARYPELRMAETQEARRALWQRYCSLSCSQRAELIKQTLRVSEISILEIEALTALFGHHLAHDAYTLPHASRLEMFGAFHAPALMITGWYDWSMNDALATWDLLVRHAREPVSSRSRLLITPSAHNAPGYHEGHEQHPELRHDHRVPNHVELLLRWYTALMESKVDAWPTVIYYLMGANEWFAASAWPPPGGQELRLYLSPGGALVPYASRQRSAHSSYVYDPENATPTVGGSIVSYVYRPGSADASEVQRRGDVLSFTTPPLERDLDVVGPLRLTLHASSSATDTDFSARLSDVFPDGRAIQLQTGMWRARHREPTGEPKLLEPGRIYEFEIDMWATANRFRRGHRLRVDISSADFPRFDRNTNRGGEPGAPLRAIQTIHHDRDHPSHLQLRVMGQYVARAS